MDVIILQNYTVALLSFFYIWRDNKSNVLLSLIARCVMIVWSIPSISGLSSSFLLIKASSVQHINDRNAICLLSFTAHKKRTFPLWVGGRFNNAFIFTEPLLQTNMRKDTTSSTVNLIDKNYGGPYSSQCNLRKHMQIDKTQAIKKASTQLDIQALRLKKAHANSKKEPH